MWSTKKKMQSQRHIDEFGELDGGIPEKEYFTRVQIKPKFLQG